MSDTHMPLQRTWRPGIRKSRTRRIMLHTIPEDDPDSNAKGATERDEISSFVMSFGENAAGQGERAAGAVSPKAPASIVGTENKHTLAATFSESPKALSDGSKTATVRPKSKSRSGSLKSAHAGRVSRATGISENQTKNKNAVGDINMEPPKQDDTAGIGKTGQREGNARGVASEQGQAKEEKIRVKSRSSRAHSVASENQGKDKIRSIETSVASPKHENKIPVGNAGQREDKAPIIAAAKEENQYRAEKSSQSDRTERMKDAVPPVESSRRSEVDESRRTANDADSLVNQGKSERLRQDPQDSLVEHGGKGGVENRDRSRRKRHGKPL